jgi:hypothetical protein
LVREPEATLKSTMDMLKCREQEALQVYVKRLGELSQYGRLLGNRAMLMRYDDLVDRSQEALAELTYFLGLASPLTPTYTTHRMTARAVGNGDPSDNIKAGRIIRTGRHGIPISDDALDAAMQAYHNCQAELYAAAVETLKADALRPTRRNAGFHQATRP